MSRKLFLALIIALTSALIAGEVRTYAPPPDTPVIPWTRFNIQYAVRIVGSGGPTKVMFYMTTDGGVNWRLYGEDKDLRSPMMVTVPAEGTYGFATIVSTSLRPGNPPRPGTRPDRFVIVDRTPPLATWITPGAGEIALNANGSITLAWEASDLHLGLTPVTLEYSTDGGNFWLPLREQLPAKGSINWTPPLLEGENEIMLRLIAVDLAGNRRIVKNHARFLIDRQPPAVSILGPNSAGGYEFDINYRAVDDQSGIGQVEMYYTLNDGQEWFFFDSDKDLSTQTMKFHSPTSARRIGLYLVAADKRGNRTAPPARGARPMLNVEVDLQAPQVTILPPFSSTSTVIGKTEPTMIRWSASDVNIKENSAKVEYSADNGMTWVTLADNQPSNGSFSWTPNIQGDNILIKVTVDDQMGNHGTGQSMPFRVDDKRPATNVTDVRPITPAGGNSFNANPVIPPVNNGATDNPWNPTIPGGSSAVTPVNPADSTTSDLAIPGTYDPMAGTTPPANSNTNVNSSAADTTAITPPVTSVAPIAPVASTNTTNVKPSDIDIPGFPSETDNTPAANTGIPSIPTDNTNVPAVDMPKPIDNTAAVSPPAPPVGNTDSGMAIPPIPGEAASTTNIPPIGNAADTTIPPLTSPSIPDVPSIPTNDNNDIGDIGKIPSVNTPAEPVTNSTVNANPTQLLEQAEQLYTSGSEQDKALDLTKQALDKDPNNARGYALLASIYTEKEKYEDAINNAERATRLAPGNNRYLQILGYAQYAKANSINMAIRANKIPADQVHRFTTQVVQSLEDSERAYQQMLTSANKSDDDMKEAYYRLGQIDYFRATRIQKDDELAAVSLRKSIANYEKAYGIGNQEYREILQIGICNYRLTDYDQAERWLVKAQELAPTNRPPKEAFFYLAMIHEKMDRPEQALPFWKKVADLYPQGSKYQQLASNRVAALQKQIKP